jgi:type VI secretion system secreted protein Hcp
MKTLDFFLKVDGIEGESLNARHAGEIDVLSWSWGETNASSMSSGSGGLGAGRASVSDFHFMTRFSKASLKLMQACASGRHIRSAELTGSDPSGPGDYLAVRMSDLIVSSYQTTANSGEATMPTDAVSLSFSKIEFEYQERIDGGTLGGKLKAGYDTKTNEIT